MLLEKIDYLLNSITMYRLVLYGLAFLSGVAIILGFLGILPFSGLQLSLTLAFLLTTCFISNKLFSSFFHADSNIESWWISALILFLIIAPIGSLADLKITILIGSVAMASKYFLSLHKRHIFNPAAIGMFLAGIFGFGNSVWWVASSALLPFVALVGLLIVRKIRRFQLFFTFIIASVVSISFSNFLNGADVFRSLPQVFIAWPVVFFGSIMLTEPFTTPPNKKLRLIYGILIGLLFGAQFSFGPIFASHEFALIVGNIFSFIVSRKGKIILKFKEKTQLAPTIYEFVFAPEPKFNYLPGQYMEWTLPSKHADSRGIRRYFTIASSPEEGEIKLGVKIIPEKSSSFKNGLLNLKSGTTLAADQLSGDFILPEDSTQKLVFIAGGIGVTPFRSMIKNIIDTNKVKDVVFFYSASDAGEFVYKEIFKKAQGNGVKTVYVLGGKNPKPADWVGETGYLTEGIIKKYAPDYKARKFYLSGPIAMVNNYKNLLHGLGVDYSKIMTDYFPGY